jgi:hypothetical protein
VLRTRLGIQLDQDIAYGFHGPLLGYEKEATLRVNPELR